MSHSKRNTSRAFFTNHERAQAAGLWGSQSSRLNRDSFLPFGSCQLCLLPAKDPVACSGCLVPAPLSTDIVASSTDVVLREPSQAQDPRPAKKVKVVRPTTHIFCRECAISNLLAQKQEIKRLNIRSAAAAAEAEAAQRADDEIAQARAVEEFERVQQGLAVKLNNSNMVARVVGRDGGKVILEEEVKDGSAKGTKRKFEFDETELLRIADADRAKARKLLDEEREASKTGNGSFWLPSQIGNTANSVEKKAKADVKKLQPLCPGSTERSPHPMSLKTLTPVKFSKEVGSEDLDVTSTTSTKTTPDAPARTAPTRTCPSCSRALSNASKAVLLKPCGHVLCGSCVNKFMLNESQTEHAWDGEEAEDGTDNTVLCFVCSVDCTPSIKSPSIKPGSIKAAKKKGKKGVTGEEEENERGLFDVASEGTGFAGGGQAVVKRADVVFQC